MRVELEKLIEYMLKGALVLTGASLAILILGPFIIGYAITMVVLRIVDAINNLINPKQIYRPSKKDLQRMAEKIEREKQLEKSYEPMQPIIIGEASATSEETEGDEEELDDVEGEECFEIIYRSKFLPEKNLTHEEKEALFAQGYKRLKVSPYGNSGATFYWVRTRYNESKEHAFFCYLIRAELQKYTRDIEMCTNNGPDVVVRHAGKSYCFDVETGKNLVRKPDWIKKKFLRYKNDFHRSYIFVTNKTLKRKYKKMGIVITRSTFRKTFADIFS